MKWTPLLRWYEKEGRDLPWRKTHDPYRILVSEIMLQQTQVSRVLVFYKTWLKKFPTWHALARATNADVIHAWAGLGYNRRGLTLRDIAQRVVSDGVPRTEAEWLKLKGIGPYTAAAVAAFSFGQETIPIDTNIRRVLGRVLIGKTFPALSDDPRIRKKATPYFLLSTHFQALFDLAVAVCKKDPDCASCPLRAQCKAAPQFLTGHVRIPKRTVKIVNERKHAGKPYPDRIYRGRILAVLRANPNGITLKNLGPKTDPAFDPKKDAVWLKAMTLRLVKDGLARFRNGRVRLP